MQTKKLNLTKIVFIGMLAAVVAMIAAPIVYTALSRALDHGGLLKKMRS